MGCDIHMHTEIKVNGKWLHYSQPRIKRDYELFGWIANVRREGTCLFEVKGLPTDLSETTSFCYDQEQDQHATHGETFLTAREIATLFKKREKERPSDYLWEHEQVGYLFGNGWGGWKDNPESYPSAIDDIRWVIWFDN